MIMFVASGCCSCMSIMKFDKEMYFGAASN